MAQSRLEAAGKAGDKQLAEILSRVVSGCEDELQDRLTAIMTRSIVNDSTAADRQARELLNQMTTG